MYAGERIGGVPSDYLAKRERVMTYEQTYELEEYLENKERKWFWWANGKGWGGE